MSNNHELGFPPKSHDANPIETHFIQWQSSAAKIVDQRNMDAWKMALEKACDEFPVGKIRSLIDIQPKIMRIIIENEGERTKY